MRLVFVMLVTAVGLFGTSEGMVLATFLHKSDAIKAARFLHDVLSEAELDVGTVVVKREGAYEVRTMGEPDKVKRRQIQDAMEDYFHPLSLDEAVALFKKRRYKEAYTMFQQLRLEQLDNPRLNFYLGRSAFELGKFKEALAVFDRLIKENSGNTRLQLEHARTLFMLKAYKRARGEFESVLKTPLPPRVRNNVKRYLNAINMRTKQQIFSGALIAGGGYDDNVFNHTYLGTTPYAQNSLDNNTSHIPDGFHREILSLNYLYVFESRKWAWDTALLFFNRTYNRQNSVNIMQPGVVTGPRYYSSKARYYFPLTYNYLWYGGEAFMQSVGTRPECHYLIDSSNSGDIALIYLNKQFVKTVDKDRSSNRFGVMAGLNHLYKSGALLRAQVGWIGERRIQGERKDVSFDKFSMEGRYSQGLWKNSSIYMIARLERYSYLYNDPNLSQRVDTHYRLEADVSQQLSSNLSLEARYTFTRVFSSINLYTFNKNVASLNLLATF